MKFWKIIVFVFFSLFIVSCGAEENPAQVTEKFVLGFLESVKEMRAYEKLVAEGKASEAKAKAQINQKHEKLMQSLSENFSEKEISNFMSEMYTNVMIMAAFGGVTDHRFIFLKEEIDGDTAYVTFKYDENPKSEQTFRLKKENGKWKIDGILDSR